jgi:mannose-6-phosphate isomerase-like protein (cupin superfamily)
MTGYVGSINSVTIDNDNFRRVLFTGPHMQLVVMSLEPGEDIGKERHPALDQFFRVEQGEGEVVFNDTEHHRLHDGDAILVPAGTWHNVINTSSSIPLKLYTLYAPPNHARGAVHRTKADAEEAEVPARAKGTR